MERVHSAVASLPEGVEARLLGHLEPERIADLLRAADLLTLTSRAEGMPNSLLEGMATGLACIATDIPGSRDLLSEETGVLVPLDDADALAREIDRLLGDRDSRRALGSAARRAIETSYSAARVGERYFSLYRRLLSGWADDGAGSAT
jgi:glycosyltransferase involved in cell wall biosynthesis